MKSKKVNIDFLINNAGHLKNETFDKTSYESFKETYDVNVFGLAQITRLLLPIINKSGHVINISSIGGVNGSKKFPGLSVYSSSKAAVIALTEVLAEEFPNGPSFNVLALGAVQTKMLKEALPEYVAQTNPNEMARYILDFALNGGKLFNGKLISKDFSYEEKNYFDDKIEKDDILFNKAVIDKQSLDIIAGSTVDFKKEMIGESFSIDNPKASASCGCGLSFSV